jgi:Sulfotransferase domain
MTTVKKTPTPVMVSGLQRSGTTWTAKMIELAKEMFMVVEPFNLQREVLHLLKLKVMYEWWPEVDRERFWKLRNGFGLKFTREELKLFYQEDTKFKYYFYHFQRHFFLNRKLNKNMKPVIQDPFAIFMAPWLNANLGIQMLLIYRHPAAYINSMKRMQWGFNFEWLASQKELMEQRLAPFHDQILEQATRGFISFDIDTQCLVWNIFTSTIRDYQKQHTDWLFFRHEDLSFSPVESFKNIYENLGLEFNDSIIQKIKKFTGEGNPATAKKDKMHTLKRDSRENIKSWKKHLTKKEISTIRLLTEAVSSDLYTENDWQ